MTGALRKPIQSHGEQEPKQGWVPPWMSDVGVEANGAVTLSKEQLRALMRPGRQLKVQVWACGMLHSSGYGGEPAYTMHDKRKVPLTSTDIAKEILDEAKKHFTQAGVRASKEEFARLREEKEDIRSVVADLEAEGVAERRTLDGRPLSTLTLDEKRKVSGKVLTCFFARPRAADPERVRQEWQRYRKPVIFPAPPAEPAGEPETAADISGSEVGKVSLPPVRIDLILRVFQIAPPEKPVVSSDLYQKKVSLAYEAARKVFLEKMAEEVGKESLPQVGPQSLPEVGTTGGIKRNSSRKGEAEIPAPPISQPFSSSSAVLIQEEKAKTNGSAKAFHDDDEKPVQNGAYATARDELKAIYLAKADEHMPVEVMDRIESIVIGKGKTLDEYIDVVRPHLGGNWKIPAAFLTDRARNGFAPRVSPPQEKPKPKCPTCKADNRRGAILKDGAIVPCPECSTEEWREELTAKLDRRAKGANG